MMDMQKKLYRVQLQEEYQKVYFYYYQATNKTNKLNINTLQQKKDNCTKKSMKHHLKKTPDNGAAYGKNVQII